MAAFNVTTQTVSDAIRTGRFPARWFRGIDAMMIAAGHGAADLDAFAWREFTGPTGERAAA